MELLIKRDANTLEKTEGKAFVDEDLPDFLKTPRVVPQNQVTVVYRRNNNDDLLILNEEDFKGIENSLADWQKNPGALNKFFFRILKDKIDNPKYVPGLWSGHRSALVRDPNNGKLYKLKGISLDPKKPVCVPLSEDGWDFKIEGGQEGYRVEFEKRMLDKYNRILESEGIEPAMKFKGIWKYPVLAKTTRPVGSIFEVKGDTRLDELLLVMEALTVPKFYLGKKNRGIVDIGKLTQDGERYLNYSCNLFRDIGCATGRLKRLMDKGWQTWSADSENTNSHTGNIVLYNQDDKLKVGFVDFDASCDSSDFSKSKLRAIQKKEFDIIQGSMMSPSVISWRMMDGKIRLQMADKGTIVLRDLRHWLIRGFQEGYESGDKPYRNEVDLGLLQEVFALLRQENENFSFKPRPIAGALQNFSYADIFGSAKNKDYLKINLESIIKQSYGHEKGLSEYYGFESIIKQNYGNNSSKGEYLPDYKGHGFKGKGLEYYVN